LKPLFPLTTQQKLPLGYDSERRLASHENGSAEPFDSGRSRDEAPVNVVLEMSSRPSISDLATAGRHLENYIVDVIVPEATASPDGMLVSPLVLPCGLRLENRLAKAAMSDSLGDGAGSPTDDQVGLYGRWARHPTGNNSNGWRLRALSPEAQSGLSLAMPELWPMGRYRNPLDLPLSTSMV
jgi:hypothetical protein